MLEARETAARVRVDELEEQLAKCNGRLEEARENQERLQIARETVTPKSGLFTPARRVRAFSPWPRGVAGWSGYVVP